MEDNAKLLREAIIRAKSGRIQGFEEIYFLTYEKTFQDIYAIVKDEEYSWNILKKIYLTIYEKIPDMPAVGSLDIWIQSIISKEAGSKLGDNITNEQSEITGKSFGDLSGKATSCLIEIEEKIDSLAEDESKTPAKEMAFSISKLIGALIVTVIAVAAVIFTIRMLNRGIDDTSWLQDSESGVPSSSNASVSDMASEDVKETETEPVPGLVDTDKGKKYMENDLTYAKQTWKKVDGQLYYIDKNELMVTGNMELDGQTYKFTKSGMLYGITRDYEPETADTALTRKLKEIGREDDIQNVIKDSLIVNNGQMYYLYKEEAESYPNLQRVSMTDESLELLEKNVAAFFIYEKDIYYIRDNIMEERSIDEPGEPIKKTVPADIITALTGEDFLGVQDNSFYIIDGEGNAEKNISGNIRIDGRDYRVSEGRIKYVKSIPQTTRGVTYYLNDVLDNKIYWNSSDGQAGILVEEDAIAVRSFCLAGEWIYYNLCTGATDTSYRSKICRISVDGSTKEDVSEEFSGVIQNMYYYSNVGKIFMEYQPHIPQKAYCSIAVMSLDGNMYQVDDSFIRNTQAVSGDDQMEIIMVDNSNMYCYWHECSKDASGKVSIVWTKPVAIPY